MRAALLSVAALALVAVVTADCPNACSGHGDCITNNDYCMCYNGWMGNDCSQQLCPYGLSYIDTPNGDIDGDNLMSSGGFDTDHESVSSIGALNPMYRKYGWWERHPVQLYGAAAGDAATEALFPVKANEGHFYAECSNRGICDRSSGLCQCFTGYEGTACNRTVCINDCSGHGICESVNDLTPEGLHYRLWDAEKTRVCKCDGGYFGPDCAQKKCMRNDDPLTTQSTIAEYNSGIFESGELQIVDIRCPYAGTMLGPAYVTLTYTDVQFGDNYETPMFDILTATGAEIAALLRELPNQVLASYADGSVNGFRKVISVTKNAIEANQQYRLVVQFDEHLGDVPLLSGTPYFKCKGGAEVVSNLENVVVTYDGDGPLFDLVITIDGASATTANFKVTNSTGQSLWVGSGAESGSGPLHTFVEAAGDPEKLGAGSTDYGREVAKVNFAFGLGPAAHSASELTVITIHTVPVITVFNQMYILDAAGSSRSAVQVDGTANVLTIDDTGITNVGVITANDNAFPTVTTTRTPGTATDFIVDILYVTTTVARVSINGEVWGLATIDDTPAAIKANRLQSGDLTTFVPLGSNVDAYVTAALASVAASPSVIDDAYVAYFPKTPYYASSITNGDDVIPLFLNYEAARSPFTLVLQITKINDAADTYRWKLAGDAAWSTTTYTYSSSMGTVTTATTASHAIPATASGVGTQLGNTASYAVAYPDDPARLDVINLRLDWTESENYQERLCDVPGATYYIQIGSDGVNDSPVCSDRGVCDFSAGICKCFKGYAGIDCTTQNALSMGAGANSA